jgi:putative glutamine amidotransferase
MQPVRVGVVDQGTEWKTKQYLDALAELGAEATVLAWSAGRDAAADAARFDAIVLCGGDDIDARRFGEENHPSVGLVPPERDEYEIGIVRAAVARGVPVLGVCRGAQVMNVALGGTLEQHIPDIPGRAQHGDGVVHGVEVVAGTGLARIWGRTEPGTVNSFHHQAVGRVAPMLRVAARSPDGGVEAVESVSGPFCLGVQWHPERGGNDEPLGRGLFRALVDAAGIPGSRA